MLIYFMIFYHVFSGKSKIQKLVFINVKMKNEIQEVSIWVLLKSHLFNYYKFIFIIQHTLLDKPANIKYLTYSYEF